MASSVFIETSRLILRTVTPDDIDSVVLSWKLDEEPISHEEAEHQVNWMLDNHRRNVPGSIHHLCLAIIYKETREYIGWCGLDHRNKTREFPVLFYLLKASYWGRGLATEAAGALIDYAFCELKIARINSAAAFENIASKRVMEKIGMRFVGLDDEGGYSFIITREDFLRDQEGTHDH